MAKDLPYFKFVISEWNDGDITLCSMQAQGLFINLCSLYWSQEGELSMSKSKRRYKECDNLVWAELINEKIIKLDGDSITITFLDEQFNDRFEQSKKNRKNVEKRWRKYKNDTTVQKSYTRNEEPVYNIEERRRDKIYIHGKGKLSITIKPVYAGDKIIKIHDMVTYFTYTNQIQDLTEVGWTCFEQFLVANAGRMYNDADHVYNSFRDFAIKHNAAPLKSPEFADAEFNKNLWTKEAWEEHYKSDLKNNQFRKHFGYAEL
jgi:hypothetical protein